MRVVSLNLDLDDASVVRRALGDALAACSCRELAGRRCCADCEALGALVGELDRLLTRSGAWPGRRFDGPPAPLPARGLVAQAGQMPIPGDAPDRRLWVVPGGLADA